MDKHNITSHEQFVFRNGIRAKNALAHVFRVTCEYLCESKQLSVVSQIF